MLITLVILMWSLLSGSAWAAVHTYHEQPGQTTFRSQQSLRDQQDRAWQATVFKRYTGADEPQIYLRLVGFPGVTAVAADADLVVQTGTRYGWRLSPALDSQTPALPENVAQYEVAAMLHDLPSAIPLTLQVPLQGTTTAQLLVAPFVVEEWLQVSRMAAPS